MNSSDRPVRNTQRNREQAETAVVSAWRQWLKQNVARQRINDGTVHSFLRHVKAENPELLRFSSRFTPYEAAFRWIVSSHSELEPLQRR